MDLKTLGGSFSQAIWLNDAGEAVRRATASDESFRATLRRSGARSRFQLGVTSNNVREIAAPLAHGMDALHVCDVGQHFGQPQIPLSPMREVW